MSGLKKLLFTLVSFLIVFTSSMSYFVAPAAYAQNTSPWFSQDFRQWYTKVYDTSTSPPQEIFGERYTAAQVQWVIYGLGSFLLNQLAGAVGGGSDLVVCIMNGSLDSCLRSVGLISDSSQTQSNLANVEEKSVLAVIFNPNRDLSAVNYVQSRVANLHLVPTATAQTGFGFAALGPLQNAWRSFRDIMYGFFVIIIIVFAFMIMFRVKINPQTVVTLQSAIPKVIIGLILVTFSYAIAGLLIDLLYVVIGVVALIFQQSGGFIFEGMTWAQIFGWLTDGPLQLGALGMMLLYMFFFVVGIISFCFSSVGIAAIALILGGAFYLTAIFSPLVLTVAFLIALGLVLSLIWFSLKVLVTVIKAYVNIVLLVIFAPLMIGFGVLMPGLGFGKWVKSMVANLAVYVVIGVMFSLSFFFLSASSDSLMSMLARAFGATPAPVFPTGPNSRFWYPPMSFGTQHAGSFDPLPLLWLLVSLGIISMIPKAAEIVKSIMEKGQMATGTDMGGVFAVMPSMSRLGIERRVERKEAYNAAYQDWVNKGSIGAAPTAGYQPSASTELLRRLKLYRK
jgi:hypothetical protein